MSEKSAAELEREAETARSRLMNTAETLRSRMTPGQLLDEFTGIVSNGYGATTLDHFKTQVRDNPLPLALIGAGIGWLMLGRGVEARGPAYHRPPPQPYPGELYRSSAQEAPWSEGWASAETGPGVGERIANAADAAGSLAGDAYDAARDGAVALADRARAGASGIADSAGHLADSARSRAGGVADSAAHFAHGARHQGNAAYGRTADMGRRVRDGVQDAFEREPLAIAAAGAALGVLIGMVLPRTALEDQQLGGVTDRLKASAGEALREGMDSARQAAGEAYESAAQEADRQGLTSTGDSPVADRVGSVVKAAITGAEGSVRDKIGEAKS